MHIVLINPPHPYLIQPDSQAPLGLMYLAAVLREAGHSVTLANLSHCGEDEAIDHIPWRQGGTHLYGFTATSIDYALCERLARRIRARNRGADARIVLGGPHATVASREGRINMDIFDAVCVGEGERVILDIARDAGNGKLAPVYRGERIRNLDALPLPARDLMLSSRNGGRIGGDIFAGGEHFAPQSEGSSSVITTARGCPFDCAFCASRPVWGGSVVRRSVRSVLDEVRAVRDEFGVREFRFSDDTLNLDRRRLRALCDGLGPLGVYWRASVRAGSPAAAGTDADDFKAMYDAGCREISPGVESGDQRVLDALCKGTTVPQNADLCNLASRAGLNVRVLLMTGTPGEHPDTPEITRDFLSSIDFRLVALTQFRPLPGTAIWRDPAGFRCRIIDRDLERYNFYFWSRDCATGRRRMTDIRAVIETDVMSREALEDNMRRMRDYCLATGRCNRG